jgi:hypothetical protein
MEPDRTIRAGWVKNVYRSFAENLMARAVMSTTHATTTATTVTTLPTKLVVLRHGLRPFRSTPGIRDFDVSIAVNVT